MKKRNLHKKTAHSATVIAAILAAAILTSSCGDRLFLPRASEISELEVMQVLGVDSKDGEITVTLVINRGAPSGEGGWSGEAATGILSFTGATIFEAINKMNIYSDRRLHLGYVDFLIIGEGAAHDDITTYLDFLMRDNETRYTIQVFLARGATAKEFLTQTSAENRSIASALRNIEETIKETNSTRIITLIDLIADLSDPGTAAVIPALQLEDSDFATLIGGELPEKTFSPAGFGIIKEHQLIGYFDIELARAYNYLTGQTHVIPISVDGPDGRKVALRAVTGELKFEPEWDGDELLRVKYSAIVSATVAEQGGHANIFQEAVLRQLEEQIAEIAQNELRQVVEQAKAAGHDSLGLGDRLRMRNPLKWAKISDRWTELFSTLDITVDVECRIRRSHDLREAIGGAEHGGETND